MQLLLKDLQTSKLITFLNILNRMLTKVGDTNDCSWVLHTSAHVLSHDFVSQSALDNWCVKYSVTSCVNQTQSVGLSLRHRPAFVSVT
jgi:hypothetical protein